MRNMNRGFCSEVGCEVGFLSTIWRGGKMFKGKGRFMRRLVLGFKSETWCEVGIGALLYLEGAGGIKSCPRWTEDGQETDHGTRIVPSLLPSAPTIRSTAIESGSVGRYFLSTIRSSLSCGRHPPHLRIEILPTLRGYSHTVQDEATITWLSKSVRPDLFTDKHRG